MTNNPQAQESKLFELLRRGYTLKIIYHEKEDIIKDIDDGKVDDLFSDPVPKAIDLALKNKNFVDPGPDGIVETTFIPRGRFPRTKYQRPAHSRTRYGQKK